MKNREFLQSISIFDLFMKVRRFADSCPIYAATGEKGLCDRCNKYRLNCAACFGTWMNEERKERGMFGE